MKTKFFNAISLAVILTVLLTSLALAEGTPTISSDLPDYAPGTAVTLFGTGWQAGESVNIFVNDSFGSSWNRNIYVTAADDGTIVDTFNLPDWFVAVYSVTATGSISGTATASFTDAVNVSTYVPTGTNSCSTTGQASFTLGDNVCAKATGLGGSTYKIQWFNSSNELKDTSANSSTGNLEDTFIPDSSGTWTLKVVRVSDSIVVGSTTFTVIAPANTSPSVSVTGVTDGAIYEYGSVPAAGCLATDLEDDNSSFLATLSAITGPLSAYGLGSQTATCNYTDKGGLSAPTASATYTIVDTTAPEVSCGTADGIWHAGDVSITCTASDIVGLAIPADASFSLVTSVLTGTEDADASTNSYDVYDVAGNFATAGPISGNMVDKKAPSIAINAPAGTYLLNQVVASSFSCDDGGSGVATCDGPASVDTSSVGSHTFTVNSSDNVGNASSADANYGVIYNWNGFFQPIDNDKLNGAKAGSAIPVKFSLSGNQGLNIFAVGYPKSIKISCDNSAQIDDIETTVTAGGSSLSYDALADQYIYVWKTEKSWAGTCRQLQVVLNDGTLHTANFKFK